MRKIVMPAVGKTGGALTVRQWFKAPGDRFDKGEILAQVEGLDGLIELEAAQAGRLSQIVVVAGSTVEPETIIAEIEEIGSLAVQESMAEPSKDKIKGETSIHPVVPILMPQAGNSMEEGTIIKWLVKEGDRVTVGQVLFEIETDKATMEVEATEAGRLAKIIAGPGAVIPVKQPVGFLSDSDIDLGQMAGVDAKLSSPTSQNETLAPSLTLSETLPASPARKEPTADKTTPIIKNTEPGFLKASPLAKKIARENGLDLNTVGTGSGPGGRILSLDLDKAASFSKNSSKSKPGIAPVGTLNATETIRKKMSKMRKAIAANLQMSKQTVPHFYLRCTVDAGPMMDYYRAEKTKYPCSLNDMVTLACAKTIIEFPAFRSRIDKDELVEYPAVNIGIAVGVEDGLTVPVLLNAHMMNLQQIAAHTRRIVENARAGKLEGFGQGSFTITNLGMFGVEEFAAIVNPPEPGILAVGAVRETVLVKEGAMKAGKVMTMTLSCDHRLVDGLLAAKFMARLKELLENPGVMA